MEGRRWNVVVWCCFTRDEELVIFGLIVVVLSAGRKGSWWWSGSRPEREIGTVVPGLHARWASMVVSCWKKRRKYGDEE